MKRRFSQSPLGLYFGYMRIIMAGQMQYKGWLLLPLPSLIYVITDPLDALLMLDRFGAVGEWTAARILLIYGMALLSFGLSELLGRGFDMFPHSIRDGAFDRVLLRPRSTFLQSLTLSFSITRLSRVSAGLILVILTLAAQSVRMTLPRLLVLLGALAGGVMTYVGLFIINSVISFFTISPIELNIFTNAAIRWPKRRRNTCRRDSGARLHSSFRCSCSPIIPPRRSAAGASRAGWAVWRCRSAARSSRSRCCSGASA